MHDAFHLVTLVVMIGARFPGHREDIVMQVAVAYMAEAVDPVGVQPRKCLPRTADKFWNTPYGNRDIMRRDRPDPAVRFGYALADGPEGATLAL